MEEQGNLFDTEQGNEQEPTAVERVAEQLRTLREIRKQLEGTGVFVLLPTDVLLKRSEAYFNLNYENVARLLTTSGVTEDVAELVLQDYAAILAGVYFVQLPLKAQADVLKTVKPWRLQFTERYGLTLLFGIYFQNTQTAKSYIEGFKLATGDVERTTIRRENGKTVRETEHVKISVEEQKNNYLNTQFNRIISGFAPQVAAAFYWIKRNKAEQDGELLDIIEPSDFSGVEPERVNKFLAYVEAYAGISDYVSYYYIAKYALKATPDELKEIEFPPIMGDLERAQEYAERIGSVWDKNIQDKAAEVERLIAAETVEDIKKAQHEITEPDDTEETIRIPENIALLGSRDVYASVNGTEITEQGVIPISRVIAIYGQRRKDLPANVTPYTVEKAIQGLNMLQRFNHNAPVGGWYTYETNITEFSRLCGYDSANMEERTALMHSLMILRDLYVIVWKPKGRVAIQLLTVPEIGVSGELKGQFKLQVNAQALKGHQNYITLGEVRKMQKDAKGQAQTHFNSQLIAKGQKEENALIAEVFGYDTMLREATGYTDDERVNPDAVRNVKEFIRKNKPNHRKKIAKWFEEYREKGYLESYSRTKNARGEYVYKWRRGNVPKAQDGAEQEPDEQPQQ